MAGNLFKAGAVALGTAYGAHATYAWLVQRGGLAHNVTDIDPNEFFPALFTLGMLALILG